MATLHYLRQTNTQQQNYNNTSSTPQKPTEWYQTLWGLAILTVGLNILSNFLYDRGREQLRQQDKRRQRRKDIDELVREGKTEQEAIEIEDAENKKLDIEQEEGYFGPPN